MRAPRLLYLQTTTARRFVRPRDSPGRLPVATGRRSRVPARDEERFPPSSAGGRCAARRRHYVLATRDPMTTNRLKNTLTRESILELLTDGEVAKVARAE